ncbi:MAG: ribonuclease E/G [Asticcacaulis sp.]|uniref:ribonuclease E/G n=1 Tax=Asticcacaulis sp. TaxID=1872648 RepID=UPI0039E6DBD8
MPARWRGLRAVITLHYESRFGLARGAVCIDGRPHLYAEGYEFNQSLTIIGTRSVARLKAKAGGMAFLAMVDGDEAVLDVPQEVLARLNEGAALEVGIVAEARQDKRARACLIGPVEGEPRRLSPVLSLKERLLNRANAWGEIFESTVDLGVLGMAEEAALNPSGALPEGGYLSIERTRALIACDVDSAGGEGIATSKAFAKGCNERAVSDIGRRLRLSGLAGLVVIDLIGKRHDAERLHRLLKGGFGAEAGQLIVGPVGKFGTLEFVRPWGATPLMDTVHSPVRSAHRLLREAVVSSEGEPGRLLTLRAPAGILDIIRPLLAASYDPLSAIIRLEAATRSEVIVT